MRALTLATVTTCLACAGVQNPGEPPGPDPARSSPSDSTSSPQPMPWAHGRVIVPLPGMPSSRPAALCPMPVWVPPSGTTAPMPVLRIRSVPRMPVVRLGCVNPLFRRDTARR